MKIAILVSATFFMFFTQIAMAVSPLPKDSCGQEWERVRNNAALLASKRAEFKQICNFKNSPNMTEDERFLLKKWGSSICSQWLEDEYQYEMQCRYKNIFDRGVLSAGELMAVAGYTAYYYNNLTPKNIAKQPGSAGYEGYDVFNRVLLNAMAKLNRLPEYQYNDISYRGTSFYGRVYKAGDVFTLDRWTSSSCAKEVAFGPETIEKSEEEKAKIIAEEGEDAAGLEYLLVDRDPKSIPKNMNLCQKIYFAENPAPPLSPDANFSSGDLEVTILPPSKGISKRVALYDFSERRSEAEILVPLGVRVQVVKVIGESDPGNERYKAQLILQELP